ncbi:ankyrin [Teratosphaeria nubilosa]|uniref:Ankyrin n=1 Tax=Teratosphaeria nubilosa TaxID=161662 RepID=A0A6G1LCX1_9PEZI|nr:ankyrin [Teratosphaeria nubilosa]
MIKGLLERGITAHQLQTCLLRATESQRCEIVELLLRSGVPLSSLSLPVEPALQRCSFDILSLFLKYGWDINEEQEWCTPPLLSLAILTNPDPELVAWFLQHRADPNKACQIGTTPLSTAVYLASRTIIEMMLSVLCPNPKTQRLRGELLHMAACRADPEAASIVQLMLDLHPDVNARQWEQEPLAYATYKVTGLGTPLHCAARTGIPRVAQTLLEHGADVKICDTRGQTALQVAEAYGNTAVAEVLRER